MLRFLLVVVSLNGASSLLSCSLYSNKVHKSLLTGCLWKVINFRLRERNNKLFMPSNDFKWTERKTFSCQCKVGLVRGCSKHLCNYDGNHCFLKQAGSFLENSRNKVFLTNQNWVKLRIGNYICRDKVWERRFFYSSLYFISWLLKLETSGSLKQIQILYHHSFDSKPIVFHSSETTTMKIAASVSDCRVSSFRQDCRCIPRAIPRQ